MKWIPISNPSKDRIVKNSTAIKSVDPTQLLFFPHALKKKREEVLFVDD